MSVSACLIPWRLNPQSSAIAEVGKQIANDEINHEKIRNFLTDHTLVNAFKANFRPICNWLFGPKIIGLIDSV